MAADVWIQTSQRKVKEKWRQVCQEDGNELAQVYSKARKEKIEERSEKQTKVLANSATGHEVGGMKTRIDSKMYVYCNYCKMNVFTRQTIPTAGRCIL